MRAERDASWDRYRQAHAELHDAKRQATQSGQALWTPSATTHARLPTTALTPHLQAMARLEAEISALERAIFGDTPPPSDADLFAADPAALATLCDIVPPGPENPDGVFEVLRAASSKDHLESNGHASNRPESLTIALDNLRCTMHQRGSALRITLPDSTAYDVAARTPSTWIVTEPSSGQVCFLEWDVHLNTGTLTEVPNPDALHPIKHRADEPGFVARTPHGWTFAFENGFAFDEHGGAGCVDLERTATLSWHFRCTSPAGYLPPYEAPEPGWNRPPGVFAQLVKEPWRGRFEPIDVAGSDQCAWKYLGPETVNVEALVGLEDRIYSRPPDLRDLEMDILVSPDGRVIVFEDGRPNQVRIPVDPEPVDPAAGSWMEHGHLYFQTRDVAQDGDDFGIVWRLAAPFSEPVHIKRDEVTVPDTLFEIDRWVVWAKNGHFTAAIIEDRYPDGYLAWRPSETGPVYTFIGSDGPRDGLLEALPHDPTPALGRLVRDGRVYMVIARDADTLVARELALQDGRLVAPTFFRFDGTEWNPASSGFVRGDGVTQSSWVCLRGAAFRAEDARLRGTFRVFKDDLDPEQHLVRIEGDRVVEMTGDVPGLRITHQGTLHDIALPSETIENGAVRLGRLITADQARPSSAVSSNARLLHDVLTCARGMIANHETTTQELCAALLRGDEQLVGARPGLTGRELRRAVGLPESRPYAVWVRRSPFDGPSAEHPVTMSDGVCNFPGKPDRFVIVDANGHPAEEAALNTWFDDRVPSFETLAQITPPSIEAEVVAIDNLLSLHLSWPGGYHMVPVVGAHDAETEAQLELIAERLEDLCPKLIRALSRLENCSAHELDGLADIDSDGALRVALPALQRHRLAAIDSLLVQHQIAADRELQLLAAIAVKLGEPPADHGADPSIGDVIPVHWERLVSNIGGVLHQNPYLDRLALAVAIDPEFGPGPVRQTIQHRLRQEP